MKKRTILKSSRKLANFLLWNDTWQHRQTKQTDVERRTTNVFTACIYHLLFICCLDIECFTVVADCIRVVIVRTVRCRNQPTKEFVYASLQLSEKYILLL